MSKPKWTGELTVKRLSPLDSTSDNLWKWFLDLRKKGMSATTRATDRKSGSIVIYDATLTEISRWNFTNAWPSKIQNDGFDVAKNDPVAESITLQYETLERIK
jgi:phage tail-like protein